MDARQRMGLAGLLVALVLLLDRGLRVELGAIAGRALEPVFGFHGRYPHLSVVATGIVVVLATTLVRHATTDWVETARTRRLLGAWNRHVRDVRRTHGGATVEALDRHEQTMLSLQRDAWMRPYRTMPLTMVVVIPSFAWLAAFLQALPHAAYGAPWNPRIDLLQSTLMPHWVLLYLCISIPVGALASSGLKALRYRTHPLRSPPPEAMP